jgi:amidophosphoribosyltransferase
VDENIHEHCGIALIRLVKPLPYYQEKYGNAFFGINKLFLLLEKQHNRGQDGAGIASIKFDTPPGSPFLQRTRSAQPDALEEIFGKIRARTEELQRMKPAKANDTEWLKRNVPFLGELLLGHVRYGTYGKAGVEYCHPFKRQSNWKTKNLAIAGNFNLTNVDELFAKLLELGQHPKDKTDTITILENIGHFLDSENERLFRKYKEEGHDNSEISGLIATHLNIKEVLHRASKRWDGGYAVAGLFGHGDAFVLRDPNGIRPAFYYMDDEVVVAASERPAIQTVFNVDWKDVHELKPGNGLIIRKNGKVTLEEVNPAGEMKACSFERIYFSRGNDRDIYRERKMLGKLLVAPVLKAIDNDFENTVFSFVPNTAEVAFLGMMEEIRTSGKSVEKFPRIEKIALKDTKLRTFITNDLSRDDRAAHVYDTTYGVIQQGKDNLVILDDSIVRGTTLRQSIIRILDRLQPKKIIVVSSAPQIRYPDCYGIDMAKLGDLIAFQAAVSLLKEGFNENLLDDLYERIKTENGLPKTEIENLVKEIYEPFTAEDISNKIAELIHAPDTKAKVEVIFQDIKGLHTACPEHTGDWYFTGNYPTPGGNKVANQSFLNYMEGKNVRAY